MCSNSSARFGLVTSEGIKRINTTELQTIQGAGSLLERIKGEVSGLTAGQPLSPKVQADLFTQLSNLLEKSAYSKYSTGFDQTLKRYPGLTETEQKLPAPGGGSSAPQTRTATIGGQKVTFTKGPKGWTAPGINGVYDDAGNLIKGGG